MPLRSSEPTFNYQDHCLFCSVADKYGGRKKDFNLIPVRSFDFQDTVFQVCRERHDKWSETVQSRIAFVGDLHAADAVYHKLCHSNFLPRKQIPQCFQTDNPNPPKKQKVGRPKERPGMMLSS